MRSQDVAIYSLWNCLLSENWVVMASQEQNPGDATRPLTDSTSQVLKAACGRGETEAQRTRCGRAGVVMQVDTLPTQQITSAAWPWPLRIKLYFQLLVRIFKNLSSPTPPPSSSLSFFLLDIKMFSSFLSLFSLFLPPSFLLSSFVYLFFFNQGHNHNTNSSWCWRGSGKSVGLSWHSSKCHYYLHLTDLGRQYNHTR